MKKYILIILIGVTGMTLNSCDEDTVNLSPIGGTEAGFFQNESEMKQAVLGVYQKQTFFYQWADHKFLQRIDLLPSDDITVNGSYPHENFNSLNGSDERTNDIYKYAYQLIARANIVLQKVEENGSFAYAADSDADDWHKGEALFLRSLMYFKLWNVYGTAPLVTERISDLADAYPPNSTGTQLLDQAIIDLTESMTLLPEVWEDDSDGANLGRANKNSAKGLLVKILVFRGTVNNDTADFGTAITVFNGITGRSLTPHYDDNFDFEKENNVESIFEFQANRQSANANTWVGGGNDAFAVIGEINTTYAYFTGGFFGSVPHFTATQSLMETYEVGDPRLALTYDTSSGLNKIIKYVSHDDSFNFTLSTNNPRVLRYADVMLLAAEAMVRSGGSINDAIGLVNQIRTRARNSGNPVSAIPANLTAPATAAEALAMILKERRMELAGEEGHRWQDLRRRHLAGEIDLGSWDFGSVNGDFSFSTDNINFPFPDNEVLQSPNLNQNAGY